jgi:hypothetical protein
MFHESSGAGYESSADRQSPRLIYDLRRELGYDESAAGLESSSADRQSPHTTTLSPQPVTSAAVSRRKLPSSSFTVGRESPPLGYAEAGITASLPHYR